MHVDLYLHMHELHVHLPHVHPLPILLSQLRKDTLCYCGTRLTLHVCECWEVEEKKIQDK